MWASLAVTRNKCVIDCGFGQYRTQYIPSRLRRSGVYRTALSSLQSITHKYMPERRSRKSMYRVRYCRRARSTSNLLHARLGYQHFFPFFLLYSGSKSSPYRVILDRLSGQYHEIWTGLGCRGLASCMTMVTCRVIMDCIAQVLGQ